MCHLGCKGGIPGKGRIPAHRSLQLVLILGHGLCRRLLRLCQLLPRQWVLLVRLRLWRRSKLYFFLMMLQKPLLSRAFEMRHRSALAVRAVVCC